jgi:hypothetical protein
MRSRPPAKRRLLALAGIRRAALVGDEAATLVCALLVVLDLLAMDRIATAETSIGDVLPSRDAHISLEQALPERGAIVLFVALHAG